MSGGGWRDPRRKGTRKKMKMFRRHLSRNPGAVSFKNAARDAPIDNRYPVCDPHHINKPNVHLRERTLISVWLVSSLFLTPLLSSPLSILYALYVLDSFFSYSFIPCPFILLF